MFIVSVDDFLKNMFNIEMFLIASTSGRRYLLFIEWAGAAEMGGSQMQKERGLFYCIFRMCTRT